jgi:FkbM family methyltransferase
MSFTRVIIRGLGRQIRKPLRKLGYDIVPARRVDEVDVRTHWISQLGVDLVVDVGANHGQFAGWIRDKGYQGPVLSFEPQASAFKACKAARANDSNWWGFQSALGEQAGESDFNVAGNSMSSSLLPMLDTHINALPESATVSTGKVTVARLDGVNHERLARSKSIFLKIDTQGYELPVLLGASGIMDKITFIEAELSLVPLYSGQVLMADMINEIGRMGFTPIWIEQGFADNSNAQLLQVDGLFVKTTLLNVD